MGCKGEDPEDGLSFVCGFEITTEPVNDCVGGEGARELEVGWTELAAGSGVGEEAGANVAASTEAELAAEGLTGFASEELEATVPPLIGPEQSKSSIRICKLGP